MCVIMQQCCYYALLIVVVRNKACDVLSFSIPEDLWECLEQASGKPIAAVMNSWTKQMGFPIIAVDEEQVTLTNSFSRTSRLGFDYDYIISYNFFWMKVSNIIEIPLGY